jgi:polyamine oxidase
MGVLRQMFPGGNVPEPTDMMTTHWGTEPWTYGSYSNWPVGTTLEMHQNLRANVQRLWFAGEAMSAQFFGFLHGAWFEGQKRGQQIASLLQGEETQSGDEHYEKLHGTTDFEEYNPTNGWEFPLAGLD